MLTDLETPCLNCDAPIISPCGYCSLCCMFDCGLVDLVGEALLEFTEWQASPTYDAEYGNTEDWADEASMS